MLPHDFNPHEAAAHLRMIAGDRPPVHMCFRLAYKITNADHAPGYYPRVNLATGERYLWLEQAYSLKIRPGRDISRSIASITNDIGERIHSLPAAAQLKVMIAPALFSTRPGATRRLRYVDRPSLHIVALDYDAAHTGPMPDHLLRQLLTLRPRIVRSGSPHSFHAYVGVDAHHLSLDDHDRISRMLRAHFNCDSKARPNDLLGMPGTYNPKAAAISPVSIIRTKSSNPIIPDLYHHSNGHVIAELLNLSLPDPLAYSPITATAPKPAQLSEQLNHVPTPTLRCLRRRVREYFDRNGTDDLSRANYHIVSLCAELKLTPDQAFAFMIRYLPAGSFKFADRPDELAVDIQRIYSRKVTV